MALANDVLLGGVAMLYTWVVYPLSEKLLHRISRKIVNVSSVFIVIGFVALCAYRFL